MMVSSEDVTGSVFNIQRYSLHDGPGIRTTVFLSGCPMSCQWCSNPESQPLKGTLMHNSRTCLRCGRCAQVCPAGAITMTVEGPVIDRVQCDLCGVCADNCPPHAMKLSAKRMTVDEVMQVVRSDRPFYRRTGGGVTVSGGEPLLQPEFANSKQRSVSGHRTKPTPHKDILSTCTQTAQANEHAQLQPPGTPFFVPHLSKTDPITQYSMPIQPRNS